MKRFNEKPVRKTKLIYFQLGLIAALAIALFFIEQTTKEVNPPKEVVEVDALEIEKPYNKPIVLEKKTTKTEQPKAEKKPELPKDEFKIDNNLDKVFGDPEPKADTNPDLEDPIDDAIPDPVIKNNDKPVGVDFVSEVPIFPGCEVYETRDERSACFSSKIKKMVNRKFNNGLGADLGLQGQHRIYVFFTIDKAGKVTDVKASSKEQALAEEAIRVAKLLPQMKPGKQNGKAVAVTYSLPIVLEIQ